jgi:REP element-mobilizing transposase RayT
MAYRMHRRISVRRSLRLRDFDYAAPGAYFVTTTINERAALLGSLNESTGGVELNDAGKMVERWWLKLPQKFESVTLDAHAIMPVHCHGIVLLECSDDEPRTSRASLSKVIQWFKTMTTAEYFRGVQNQSWRLVNGRIWQRGFYDHVIRTEQDLFDIRAYVEGNSGALFERYSGRTSGSAATSSS